MKTRHLVTLMIAVAAPLRAQATPTQTTVRPAAPVVAETDAATQTITFDDAIAIALRQNTTLRQANNASALNSATVRQQRLSLLPDLRFTTSTGRTTGAASARTKAGSSIRRRSR